MPGGRLQRWTCPMHVYEGARSLFCSILPVHCDHCVSCRQNDQLIKLSNTNSLGFVTLSL